MASSNTNTLDGPESMRNLEDTADVNSPIGYCSSLISSHRIFDSHPRSDLHQYRSSDIAFKQLSKCSFGISDTNTDTEERKERIYATGDFKPKSANYANVTKNQDAKKRLGDAKINLKSLRWGRDQMSRVPQFKRPGLSSTVHAHKNFREEKDVVLDSRQHRSPNARASNANTVEPQRLSKAPMAVDLMRKLNMLEGLTHKEFHEVVPQLTSSIHSLYSERNLLRRDISTAVMKEGKTITALIDFDLSTIPDVTSNVDGIERPGTSGSVIGTFKPVAVSNVHTSLNGSVDASEQDKNGKCQEQCGTAPFMAIEALELFFFSNAHELCHDLESLLYVLVWHGIGYRWKEGRYRRIWSNDEYKNVDLLRPWRVGSWTAIAEKKFYFLSDVSRILVYVNHDELRDKCYMLTKVYNQRAGAMRGIKADINMAKRSGRKRQDIIFANEPVFPHFADIWGFRKVECQNSCCVESISRF